MRFESTLRHAALAAVAAVAALTVGAVVGGCARDAEAPPTRPAPPPPRPARPLVALVRHAPWGIADDDRPLFLLYDDGQVVVPRTVDGVVQSYRTARLDLADRDAALARLGIDSALYALPPTHALAPPSDAAGGQEVLVLCVWRGDTVTRVAVGVPHLGRTRLPDGTPRPFRDAWRALTAFRPAGATDWHPAVVEVAARPYEYAPDDPPLRWPKGWPGLDAPGVTRRELQVADTVWTIPLPYERLGELRRLLRQRRTRQAVRIGDRKMAVSWRTVFPGEALWRAELARLDATP